MREAPKESKRRANLLDLVPQEADARLREFAALNGQPAYRATQIVQHLWKSPRAGFDEMSQLPREFRDQLESAFGP